MVCAGDHVWMPLADREWSMAMPQIIKNAWYVATLATSVADTLWGDWVAGEPVLLYRQASGEIVALDNRCPHRHAPLSMGIKEGDTVRCGYHGFVYAATGKCLEIPGQARVPDAMRTRRFPVIERYGLVWIWTGDRDKADPDLIPCYPYGRDEYIQYTIEMNIDAPVWNLIDNLLDLTHVGFLHSKFRDTNPIHEGNMRTVQDGDILTYVRELGRPRGVTQQNKMIYYAPGVVNAIATSFDADGKRVPQSFHSSTLHCVTPTLPGHSRYIALRSCNHEAASNPLAAPDVHEVTLEEDRVMVEAIMRLKAMSGDSLQPERLVRADRAAVQARRLYDAMLKREAGEVRAGSSH